MNIIYKINKLFIVTLCLTTSCFFSQSSKFKVVLDAGHGGKDFGACYNGHVEKKIALAVVLKVGKLLENNPNIDVVYTRKTDVFVELDERARIANREDATIFVSIHCNANKSPVGEGFETYVMGVARNKSNLEVAKLENDVVTLEKDYLQNYEGYDPKSPESTIGIMMQQEEYIENSISLAGKVQDNFASNKERKNRGVRAAGFLVLRKIAMPRILIEIGFISNGREGNFLDSEEGQEEVASDIAAAIAGYKKEYYGSGNNEPTIEKVKAKSIIDTPNVKEVPIKTFKQDVLIKPEESKKSESRGIVFKVQISASGKKLETKPSNFKGLKNISVSTDNGTLYKYTYEQTSNYDEAKQNLAEAKEKGYESAYIVAFKDGKKIDIKEAIKQ
jgi:N-acetylmuramoyl-L-alanine amidase